MRARRNATSEDTSKAMPICPPKRLTRTFIVSSFMPIAAILSAACIILTSPLSPIPYSLLLRLTSSLLTMGNPSASPHLAGSVTSADTAPFPPHFVFGTATAAYQIEGAAAEGGRAPSIWDDFSHTPNKTARGDTGDVACDHYHRFRDDVALLSSLGAQSYRFSIAWPRILPRGTRGGVNPAGVKFYSDLIDSLLAAGIAPVVTLYHWDLPSAVHADTGGWADPRGGVAGEFAAYARVCFKELGGRVKEWITLNEPWCSSLLGYGNGEHAPGAADKPGVDPYWASHNLLRAHAAAVAVYRAEFVADQKGKIGITLNSDWAVAKPGTGAEGEAAVERYMAFNLGWFADPVWKGDYPEVMRSAVGDRLPTFTDEEKKTLKGSADFFGLNHYSTHVVSLAGDSPDDTYPTFWKDQALENEADPAWGTTNMGWSIVPQGLRGVLNYIHQTYSPPGGIVVTENGLAAKEPDLQAAEADTTRISFYRGYIGAVRDAISDGVDVRGYFLWSFMDNFEWACMFQAFLTAFSSLCHVCIAGRIPRKIWSANANLRGYSPVFSSFVFC